MRWAYYTVLLPFDVLLFCLAEACFLAASLSFLLPEAWDLLDGRLRIWNP